MVDTSVGGLLVPEGMVDTSVGGLLVPEGMVDTSVGGLLVPEGMVDTSVGGLLVQRGYGRYLCWWAIRPYPQGLITHQRGYGRIPLLVGYYPLIAHPRVWSIPLLVGY